VKAAGVAPSPRPRGEGWGEGHKDAMFHAAQDSLA